MDSKRWIYPALFAGSPCRAAFRPFPLVDFATIRCCPCSQGSIASFLKRCYRLSALGVLALGLRVPAFAAEPPPLQMGVLPYLSGERLFENFLPMKEYLEGQRAARGDYDIYQAAPHFALLAEAEQGYRRVAQLTRQLDGDVIVHRDGPVRKFFEATGYGDVAPITDADMARRRSFLPDLKERLK